MRIRSSWPARQAHARLDDRAPARQLGKRWIVAGRSRESDRPASSFERVARVPPEATSAGERPHPAGHHTSVWEIDATRAHHLPTVPSARDGSCCRLTHVAEGGDPGEGGRILMSYDSQHDRLPLPAEPPLPSDVYLAPFSL